MSPISPLSLGPEVVQPESVPIPGNVLLRRLVEQLPIAALFRERDEMFPNRAAEALIGRARAEVATVDAWFANLFPGRHVEARARYERDRGAAFPAPAAVWLTRGDGEERLVEFAVSCSEGVEVWAMRDVTEPRRMARLMAQTARASQVGGWEVDQRTGRLFWTEETYRIHEVDPETYKPEVATALAFYAPESKPLIADAVQRAARTGEGFDLELALITARGRRLMVRTVGVVEREGGRVVRLFGSFQDVTERRRADEERGRLERELQDAQKRESLGVLAGGIAHDFNNLLAAILGNAELLRLAVPSPTPAATESLEQIEKAAERAADLCRQMLAYAGKGRFVAGPMDLAALVRKTVPLLRTSAPATARLSVDAPDGLPSILGDSGQLGQVVLNLVLNAAEAVGEAGTIAVSVRLRAVGPADLAGARVGADSPEGEYVCLEVSDDGCGMDAATRARIFEPFFSTKFTGRGLGLAAVLGIVRRHGGVLSVESEPGRGSRFRVYLMPGTDEGAAPPAAADVAAPPAAEAVGVLVVDDEPLVRQTTAQLCRALGYSVSEAGGGAEALRKLDGVRVVLLDWTMPRLDGAATAAEIRRTRPGLPVVLMSGYAEAELLGRYAEVGLQRPVGFLKKPFTLDELDAALRAAVG